MNTLELDPRELAAVSGGDLAYDLGRVIRFVGLSGGGIFAGTAVADWVGTSLANDAKAK